MIDDKLKQLNEEFQKVGSELDRLSQISLKLSGAIEILTSMKEEEKPEVKVVEKDKKKDK